MRRLKGFTLIELMVVISIIVMLIGILLPSLGKARITARRMQNGTHVRGIQQGMVMFAQGNGGRYPGMRSDGSEEVLAAEIPYTAAANLGYTVQARFAIMLEESLFTPEYMISPSETTGKTEYVIPAAGPAAVDFGAAVGGGDTTANHYSFALLRIDSAGQRLNEWSDTTNSQAIVVGDRLLAATSVAATPATYDSIHAEDGWQGSVGYNDNHVDFISIPTTGAVNITTKYGTRSNTNDNLFIDEPGAGILGSNAHLIGRNRGSTVATDTMN